MEKVSRTIKPVGSFLSVQEFISSFVKGKTVLDVGCVEHSIEHEETETWLHKHVRQSAARVVGLDYNAPAVAELNRRGYEVVCGDAMTLDVGERFDIVTAGEIIEHVENAGALIRNLKRHLKPDGQILITTPNVFFGVHFVESLFASPYRRWNPEHVSWYCYFTLGNLLRRCGMEVVHCWYFARSRSTRRVLRPLRLKCPGVLASTLVMVAVSDGNSDPRDRSVEG
jgi:2-polyprenyl-3-methyl-5-hydroxy-6-metoxy-1,4-benzoquinol methylase